VSTARIFADCLPASSDADENTVITDHWLSFVSVRQGDLKADPSAPRVGELKLDVDDFSRRAKTIPDSRKTHLMDLERVLQDLHGDQTGNTCSLPFEPRRQPHKMPEQMVHPASRPEFIKTDLMPLSNRASILERVRNSALYSTIQKLF
jgi:hypothetical protein